MTPGPSTSSSNSPGRGSPSGNTPAWLDAQTWDGYPVEYRTFVRDGKLQGISSYHPLTAHASHPSSSTSRMNTTPPASTPPPPDSPVTRETNQVLFTQVPTQAPTQAPTPCRFRPGEIQGVALTDQSCVAI